MNRKALERLADTLTDRIGYDDGSTQQRRLQLKTDLEALLVILSERDHAVAEVGAPDRRAWLCRTHRGQRRIRRPDPTRLRSGRPHRGSHRLRDPRILKKIRRLKNPGGDGGLQVQARLVRPEST